MPYARNKYFSIIRKWNIANNNAPDNLTSVLAFKVFMYSSSFHPRELRRLHVSKKVTHSKTRNVRGVLLFKFYFFYYYLII